METWFGAGKSLTCGIDLPRLTDKLEARQLMRSLLDYATCTDFNPAVTLSPPVVM